MKHKLLKLSILAVTVGLMLPTFVYSQSSLWYLTGSKLKPNVSSWGVGIGPGSNTSSILEIGSTTKGALLPRMSTTQRDLIGTPATGLLIYNLTTLKLNQYNGSAWVEVGGDLSGYVPYVGATTDVDLGAHNLTVDTNSLFVNSTTHQVGVGNIAPEAKLHISGLVYQDSLGYSTYFGYQAGKVDDLNNRENTGFGYQSLVKTTSGTGNTAMGRYALIANITGNNNSAFGIYALNKNTTAHGNSAFGYQALWNTVNQFNVGLGYQAGRGNTSGGYNTMVGMQAMYAGTTGHSNTAIGSEALFSLVGGYSNNVALGQRAGRYQADGSTELTTPSQSVYIGSGSRGFSNSDVNSIVIGYSAIGNGANTVTIGNSFITRNYFTGAIRGNTLEIPQIGGTAGKYIIFQGGANTVDITLTTPIASGTIALTSDLDGYALLAGRAGGQTLIGGIAASENLTLRSTSHATKGKILFGNSAYDEVNNRLGIGTATPRTALEIFNNSAATGDLPGNQNSQDIAFILKSDPTQAGSRPGIIQYGLRTAGGIAYDINSAFIGSSEANVSRAATMGLYGDVGASTHTIRYLYMDARTTGAYSTATLKIDNLNRIGIALGGTIRPLSTLDVYGNVAIGTYAGVNAAPANGMIISGSVGIGTTTPATGYKLDVAGFINSAQTVNQFTYPSVNASQTADTLQTGAFTGTNAEMGTQYIAVKFTASAAHTMGDFTIRIRESADITNTTATLTGYIYSDDGGTPSKPTATILATGLSIRFGVLTTTYQTLSVGTTYTMVSGTNYWLVLKWNATPAPADSKIVLDSDVSTDMGATSTNGTTWTNTDVRLRYVIRGRTYYGLSGSSTNSTGVYGSSTNSTGVYGSSTNSTGVYGGSTNSLGVYGSSTNSLGVYGSSTNSYGVYGGSTSSIAGYFYINPSSTNTVAEIMRLRRDTSGTAADGIGGAMDWYLEDNAGTAELTGRISNILTTAASGSETSALTFWTRTGGAAIAERVRIDGAGNVGIGTTTPNAVALLDLTSTTMGFLPPRLTDAQRDAISTPPAGLVIYNTTTNRLNIFNGTAWRAVVDEAI